MWLEQARPEQIPQKEHWHIWLILAGRGFGKTRTGAETVHHLIKEKKCHQIAIIGQSIGEAFSVMVFGVSGLNACHRDEKPLKILKNQRKIIWPSGEMAMIFGGDHYDQLRGPQFDCIWIDELAKFRNPDELWVQAMMTLRMGENPKCIVTTTPRPLKILHELINDQNVLLTTGSTLQNEKNLSPTFLKTIQEKYGNTRLYAQEIEGKLFDFKEGGLWKKSHFIYKKAPTLIRIVIGVDPAVGTKGDFTGIIVAGIDEMGFGYVIGDVSDRLSPHAWVQKVIDTYHFYKADSVVIEINQGGDLIESMIKREDCRVHCKGVRATRGKIIRAEPVVALYEQRKIFHVQYFEELEDQMIAYKQGMSSPDRLDALVWALTELFLNERKPQISLFGG